MKVLYCKQSLIILPIGLRVDNIKLAIVGIVPKSQLELYINLKVIDLWLKWFLSISKLVD